MQVPLPRHRPEHDHGRILRTAEGPHQPRLDDPFEAIVHQGAPLGDGKRILPIGAADTLGVRQVGGARGRSVRVHRRCMPRRIRRLRDLIEVRARGLQPVGHGLA